MVSVMSKARVFVGGFALLSALVCVVSANAAVQPIEVIRAGTSEALNLLRSNCKPGEVLKVQEHRDEILTIVYRYFDFEEMAKRALARHWKAQTPAKQQEFIDLFQHLLFNTYLDRVESYTCGKEDVAYEGEKVDGDYAVVKTRLLGYQGAEIPVEYRMQLKNGQWKVYDVAVEGISFIGNYRSQFESILNRSSFDDLMKQLREKIASRDARAARESAGGQAKAQTH